MSFLDKEDNSIEPLVTGMMEFLRTNLIANTSLIADASSGTNILIVKNALRFERGDWIFVMDNSSVFKPDEGIFAEYEFHEIESVNQPHTLVLKEPTQKSFLLNNNARLQKTIKKAVLYEQDIYYGDRAVIPADHIAICIEPDNLDNDWIALRLLNNEFKLSIYVYVKSAGQGESEELANKICHAYATAIYNLLLGNIHLDLVTDEIQLKYDSSIGTHSIKLPAYAASDWPPDDCSRYEIQDNNAAESALKLLGALPESGSSFSSSSSQSQSWSSSSSSISSISSTCSTQLKSSSQSSTSRILTSSLSSVMVSLEQSSTSISLTSSSSMSSKSSSSSKTSSSSSSSESFSSSISLSSVSSSSISSSISLSTSSWMDYYEVFTVAPLKNTYSVSDNAVLHRKIRYMYDSRASGIEYGTVQKGSALLKAARLTWFGKETKIYEFPQVSKGGTLF